MAVDVCGAAKAVGDHAGGDRFVGAPVDEYECPGLAVLLIGVERHRQVGGKIAEADLVERQRLGGDVFAGVDVDAVLELGDRSRAWRARRASQIRSSRQHRLGAHPDQMRGELIGDLGARFGLRQHVAARDVDLVGERQRDRIAGAGRPRRVRRRDRGSSTCGRGPKRRRRSRRRAARAPLAIVPA